MNKNKYYRVREIKDNSGKTIFKVDACESILELIFGVWDTYKLESKTLQKAKEHIDSLISWKVIKEKTVFKRTVK